MPEIIKDRKIIVVNQAANYLTVGLCNAFADRFEHVTLITGSIHIQGEELSDAVEVESINRWIEKPARRKLVSYIRACWSIFWLLSFKFRKHEVFFVSLPPMAYLLTAVLPHRCSMLVWDVYPDVFKITGMKETHPLYRAWGWLNKIAFRKAYRVFTIGNRMAGLLKKYVSIDKILITPIWSIFQSNNKVAKYENPFVIKHNLFGKFVVQYSGNIGLTHRVEAMVELAEQMKEYDDVLFQVIGRGPRMPFLQALIEEKELPNCQFLPFQSDEMFPYSISAADIGVVILDEVTSKGSVPSKSYNLMSYGIPALYLASEDSELHDYAEKYGHAKCVDQNKTDEAVEFILALKDSVDLQRKYSANAEYASKHYRRANADKIISCYLHEGSVRDNQSANKNLSGNVV